MCGRQQNEVYGFGEGTLRQGDGEVSKHQDYGAEHVRPPVGHRDDQGVVVERRWRLRSDGRRYPPIVARGPGAVLTPPGAVARIGEQEHDDCEQLNAPTPSVEHDYCRGRPTVDMLQQYQQQPDYTPYGGIGYGAQPNAGYFNYAASESSWYGSPSPAGEHAQMVSLFKIIRVNGQFFFFTLNRVSSDSMPSIDGW